MKREHDVEEGQDVEEDFDVEKEDDVEEECEVGEDCGMEGEYFGKEDSDVEADHGEL